MVKVRFGRSLLALHSAALSGVYWPSLKVGLLLDGADACEAARYWLKLNTVLTQRAPLAPARTPVHKLRQEGCVAL